MAEAEVEEKVNEADEPQEQVLSIHPVFYFAQVAAVVTITKILAEILPTELYFSFRALLFDADARLAPFAVLIKVCTPVTASFFIIMLSLTVERLGNYSRLMPDSRVTILTMQVAGFSAAVLLAWPMIVHWDILADWSVLDRRTAFFIVYGLYALAYFYVSGVGAKLAYRVWKLRVSGVAELGQKWTNDALFAAFVTVLATSIQAWLGLV